MSFVSPGRHRPVQALLQRKRKLQKSQALKGESERQTERKTQRWTLRNHIDKRRERQKKGREFYRKLDRQTDNIEMNRTMIRK